MDRNIEHTVRIKAAVIYVIAAIVVAAAILYLNGLRGDISARRDAVESQRTLLAATNELIFAVGGAQSSSSLYLSTKNRTYLRDYTRSLDSIERLIDTIILLKPAEEQTLLRIGTLLREQARNITRLNLQLSGRNPVSAISERIREYEPDTGGDTLYVVNVHQDTVVSELPRKKFFKRIKEVFKPNKELVKVTVNQRTDTIKMLRSDSLPIISEVGGMAQAAQEEYTQHIRNIERQIGRLVETDKNIASELSTLLLQLHREAFDSTLEVIRRSEEAIARNYTYSIAGGVLALALILLFIGLIIADINRGARARQALEAANERIRQVMESRHKLLLSVSHDIKTPLNSILGYLSLMDDEPRVHSMRNSSEHILAMLENLLEFSVLEQGTQQKSESDFNLRELARDICDLFLPLARQKGLALSFEADDVRISTDRVKLKQIVINLVSNAVKYTPEGSVACSVGFDGQRLRIEVRDTGAGIPADKLSGLFRPFVRVEAHKDLAEGTGLGMFVVKGLTELLGGEIRIESTVGEGTTVVVTLPADRARREIPRGAKRIRIHDDDPVVVKMLSDMLLRLGHRVTEAECDLIITDFEMGDLSGLDILREAGDVPVVVMTGRADFSTRDALEAGFDGFLAKPFSLESLREAVGEGERFDDLLGDDREAILALFRTSATENFALLRRALDADDFPRAQALCHKMFPMFAQMGYPAEALRRMDLHRSGPYDGWRDDVAEILAIKV